MTIISEIKDYISNHKLSDQDIRSRWLDEPETDPGSDEDQEAEAVPASEEQAVEEVSTTEKPDLRELVKEILAEELESLKKGKPVPKPKGKEIKKTPEQPFYRDFGVI